MTPLALLVIGLLACVLHAAVYVLAFSVPLLLVLWVLSLETN